MSAAREIVAGIARLIEALDALLQTDTVAALVDLVKQMGIDAPVIAGLEAIGTALDALVLWIGRLEQAAAVPRLLEGLAPAMESLEGLAGTSGEDLHELGMDALVPLADTASTLVRVIDKARRAAQALLEGLLPAEELRRLRESVTRFRETMGEYRDKLRAPAAATAPAEAMV